MKYVLKNELGKWDLPDVLAKLETAQQTAAEVGISTNLIKPFFNKMSEVANEAATDIIETRRTFDRFTIEEVVLFWTERIPSLAEFDPQFEKYHESSKLDETSKIQLIVFWEEVKRTIKLVPDLSEDYNVSAWARSNKDTNALARVWLENDLEYDEEELI